MSWLQSLRKFVRRVRNGGFCPPGDHEWYDDPNPSGSFRECRKCPAISYKQRVIVSASLIGVGDDETFARVSATGTHGAPEFYRDLAPTSALPTAGMLERALDALVAMQMEARARNCGLKCCDDSIDEIRAALAAAPASMTLIRTDPGSCEGDDSGHLLAFMSALHANVPEDQRPQSWSAFSDEQRERIKTAYRAMVEAKDVAP